MIDAKRLLQYCYLSEQLEMENSCPISSKELIPILEELLALREHMYTCDPAYNYESLGSYTLGETLVYRCSEDRT